MRRTLLIAMGWAPLAACARGETDMGSRLDFQRSCARLRELGLLEDGEQPQLPDRMPHYDDEEPLGVSFFRMPIEDIDLSNLTLPRTFAARSSFERVMFAGSDLGQSNFCWNDFIDCSFVDADLSAADLRASLFTRVRFDRADLSRVDLRRSSLESCTFADAHMRGAVLTRRQGVAIPLSVDQRGEVSWADDDGPEPDGG